MRKDKEKVLDEVWDEARIAGFLELRPADGSDPDHHALLFAYRGMREDDFATFIEMFVSAGRNLNATGRDGRTLLEELAEHRYGAAYAEILRRHGASG